MEGLNTFEDVVACINALHDGHAYPAGLTTYTGTPEGVAAEYAFESCEGDEDERSGLLQEAEAHLQFLIEGGAKFDVSRAAQRAREKIIHGLLDLAEQELGEDSPLGERIAWLRGERDCIVEAGDFTDAILHEDLYTHGTESRRQQPNPNPQRNPQNRNCPRQ